MKLSIVIPVFNEETTAVQLIDAVQAVETGLEKELVVVDDCSTDGTRNVLQSLKSRHPHLNLLFHDWCVVKYRLVD